MINLDKGGNLLPSVTANIPAIDGKNMCNYWDYDRTTSLCYNQRYILCFNVTAGFPTSVTLFTPYFIIIRFGYVG